MKKTLYSAFFALCCTTLSACGPVVPQQSTSSVPPAHVEPKPATTTPTEHIPQSFEQTISEDYVNQRISQYGLKLERWKEIDAASASQDLTSAQSTQIISCFRQLQKVIGGYNTLHKSFLHGENIDPQIVSQIQKEDIAFMDSTCGPMLATSSGADMSWASENTKGLDNVEALIGEYFKRGDYENVVQTLQKIPKSQQSRLQLDAQAQYAKALTYLRQESASIAVYKNMLSSMSGVSQKLDPVSLHKEIADLYTASGNYSQAQRHYNAIATTYKENTAVNDWSTLQLSILARSGSDAKELRAYSALLRDYLAFVPAQDGYKITQEANTFLKTYPYTPVASNVEKIKKESQQEADKWYNGLEARVEEYKQNDQYEEAITYLQAIPLSLFPASKATAITKKIEELLLADAIERETKRMTQVQDLQKQWNNGMVLVGAQRYDEAITVFKELIGTDYERRAEVKIDEISLTAAKNERRKAAETYVRYTKTSDFESQKKLLISARKTLKDILTKYPNTEIIPKVYKNIERIEQEMNAIAPSLLPSVEAEERVLQSTAAPSDVFDTIN